jgi:hypothetical protein
MKSKKDLIILFKLEFEECVSFFENVVVLILVIYCVLWIDGVVCVWVCLYVCEWWLYLGMFIQIINVTALINNSRYLSPTSLYFLLLWGQTWIFTYVLFIEVACPPFFPLVPAFKCSLFLLFVLVKGKRKFEKQKTRKESLWMKKEFNCITLTPPPFNQLVSPSHIATTDQCSLFPLLSFFPFTPAHAERIHCLNMFVWWLWRTGKRRGKGGKW